MTLQRRWWRLVSWVQHPRHNWDMWLKWRQRPKIGDLVEDCRNEVHTVVAFDGDEDSLVFEDGYRASWMHCCDTVEAHNAREDTIGGADQPEVPS